MELLLHSRLQDRVIEKLIRPPPVGTLCGRALLSFALRAFLSFAFCEFGADGFSCQEPPLLPTTAEFPVITSFRQRRWGRYGPQANHVSSKNRKNSKKWLARRKHFSDILKMRLWYAPSCGGACHHWHQINLLKANDDA